MMKKKNIVIGGFFHESNTFNPIITDEKDFIVFHKDKIFDNQNSYLMAKGIISFFKKESNYNILPTIFAKAVPNGIISLDYYNFLKQSFFDVIENINSNCNIDSFVLALHGSMRIEKIGDAEGDILTELRKKYPNIPIVCALDMHATITKKMTDNANAFVGFKTAPHIDVVETGTKAAEIAHKCLEENIDLHMGISHLPIMIAGEKSETDSEPMKSLIQDLINLESNDTDVLASSYFLGYPWADVEENGVTALVVTKKDKNKAKNLAKKLSDNFYSKKDQFSFSVDHFSPKDAIEIALKQNEKLTFLSDSGDNPTAGSSGDTTIMLKEILNKSNEITSTRKKILLGGIYDPEAVKTCLKNIDKEITISVGARFDKINSKPIKLTGKVTNFVKNWGIFKADLILFSCSELELILVSKHIGFTDTQMFKNLNIDYLNKDIIIVKLGYLTEEFKKIAKKAILVLSKGSTNETLSELPFKNKEKFQFI